ncbi:MAG TPA: ECF transporter S component [Nocardioidaceae bacterium]|nr:ECF transporter S component [Nocardioidaceae bacterium]
MTSTLSTSIRNLGLTSWRTIDLVTTAMLGVAFGVAYWGWSFAYEGLVTAFNAYQPASGVLGGPWLIAGVVAGLIIRKPGAALLAELIAANVEYLIGNEWGASTMVSGLLQGLGVEVVLAVFLYRRFGVAIAVLGAIVAAVAESVYEWSAYFDYWDRAEQLAYMGCFAASAAVVAGVGGWLLVRALADTGALDAFAAGREHREKRAV